MESVSVPPIQAPENKHSSAQVRLKRIALIAVILAAIVMIIEFGSIYFNKQTGNVPVESTLVVSIGSIFVSPLYKIDLAAGMFVPFTVAVEGKSLPALDVIKTGDDTWYYLLAESPETPVVNLYVKKSDGSVARLTESSTVKYNLSHDSISGKLMFQSLSYESNSDLSEDKDWDLIVYDSTLMSEITVGIGRNPKILPGGQVALFESGRELQSTIIGSNATSSTGISLRDSGPYAISTDGSQLAIYNLTTREIDLYSLNQTSASYLSSISAIGIPAALGYVHDSLYESHVSQKDAQRFFSFSSMTNTSLKQLNIPAFPNSLPQRIYAYDQ